MYQSRFHTHNWCTRVHVVYQSTLPVSILDYQLEQQYRSIYQLLSYAYYSRVVCILLEYYPYAYEFVIIEYCSTSSQYAYAIIILCIREYIILYYSSQQLCIVRLIKLEHFFCRTKYSSTSSYVLPSHDAYQLVLLFYAYYQLRARSMHIRDPYMHTCTSMHRVVDLSILYAMHSYQLVVDHFQRKPQRCTKLASSVSSDDTFYYNGYTVDYLGFPQPAQLKRLQFRAAPVSRQPQNHSADDISLIYTSGPNGSSSRSSHKIVCVSVGINRIHLL